MGLLVKRLAIRLGEPTTSPSRWLLRSRQFAGRVVNREQLAIIVLDILSGFCKAEPPSKNC